MRKSKGAVKGVLHRFVSDLESRFPDLQFEPVLDPEDGYDAWLYVLVPPNEADSEEEVRTAAREIEDKYWRDTSVAIISMIRIQKEPVHG